MKYWLTALALLVFFQNCGGNEFDASSLPSRPFYASDMISVADLNLVEGGPSGVVVITPKFNLTDTYYFTWAIVPQGIAQATDLSPASGQFQLDPGNTPIELTVSPTATADNLDKEGTRSYIIEVTLVSGDNSTKTIAQIFLSDND